MRARHTLEPSDFGGELVRVDEPAKPSATKGTTFGERMRMLEQNGVDLPGNRAERRRVDRLAMKRAKHRRQDERRQRRGRTKR